MRGGKPSGFSKKGVARNRKAFASKIKPAKILAKRRTAPVRRGSRHSDINLVSGKPKPFKRFFEKAAKVASMSLCERDKCGAVVVIEDKIVGEGFNGPAGLTKYCKNDLTDSSKPKSDRTCCVHAEWRAIMNALRKVGYLKSAVIYFTRIDSGGNIVPSGEPYCTVCSRLTIEAGIDFFALWQKDGMKIWSAEEYNRKSYKFHLKNTL